MTICDLRFHIPLDTSFGPALFPSPVPLPRRFVEVNVIRPRPYALLRIRYVHTLSMLILLSFTLPRCLLQGLERLEENRKQFDGRYCEGLIIGRLCLSDRT